LADTGEIDLADEVDNGGLFGIVGAALHLEFVDAVLVVALCRPMLVGCAGHDDNDEGGSIVREGDPRWYRSSGS
jgi:hypothetical protein